MNLNLVLLREISLWLDPDSWNVFGMGNGQESARSAITNLSSLKQISHLLTSHKDISTGRFTSRCTNRVGLACEPAEFGVCCLPGPILSE